MLCFATPRSEVTHKILLIRRIVERSTDYVTYTDVCTYTYVHTTPHMPIVGGWFKHKRRKGCYNKDTQTTPLSTHQQSTHSDSGFL